MFRIKSFKNIFVSIALPINVKWIKDYKYVFRRMNNNKHIINKLNVFLCLKELLTLFQITLYLKRGIPHSQFGFPFANFFCNFCKRKNKLFVALHSCAKKIALCTIIRNLDFAQKYAIPLLRSSFCEILREKILLKGWLKVQTV